MQLLIDIWVKFGYSVYWIFWFGSYFFGFTSFEMGVIVGFLAFIAWTIIYQIMWLIYSGEWLWNEL